MKRFEIDKVAVFAFVGLLGLMFVVPKLPNPHRGKAPFSYRPMALIDLKVEKSSMVGKGFQVEASLQQTHLADYAVLYEAPGDPTPQWIGTERVPSDVRKQLIRQCSSPAAMCQVVVKGQVVPGYQHPLAEFIDIKN